MRIRNIIMSACALLLWCGTTATAQEAEKNNLPERQPERHYKPMPLSPEKQARRTTQRMDSLLGLTEKQYDKLYALHLKEARRQAESGAPAGHPRMEGRPDRAPGGGPGFGGGNRPERGGGMRPGGGGGRPSEGFGHRPPHDFAPSSDAVKEMEKKRATEEKQRKKLEKKIRKILTDEQYERWQEERMRPPMEPERNGEGR